VAVNGRPASPGLQVTPGVDRVTVDGQPVEPVTSWTYLMMNKPVGVLTSVGDPQGRPTVTDELAIDRRLFPVGRLDLRSRGLLLLTDDGELAMRVMHPRYAVEKEYRVVIAGRPGAEALQRLENGMTVRGEHFLPAGVRVLEQTATQARLSMVLREGHKREVRRMWQALGHEVLDLQRIRIDGVHLGNLEEGATRPLTADEIAALKGAVS
jgi:23S rRNA pseudouridine2605 synthase